MPLNIFCAGWIILGGAYFIPAGFLKLYYGTGKIVLPADE